MCYLYVAGTGCVQKVFFSLADAQLHSCSYQRQYTEFAAQVNERFFKTKNSDVAKVIKYNKKILISMFCITDISEYNPKEFCKIPLMWRTVCKHPCCNKVVFCCVFVLWHFRIEIFSPWTVTACKRLYSNRTMTVLISTRSDMHEK